MPKVIYEKKKCIGAAECEIFAKAYWKMERDGKATLVGGKEIREEVFELMFPKEDLAKMKKAALYCPTECITIVEDTEEESNENKKE